MSTTVGRNPLRRNGVAIIVNKRVWNAVLGYNLKNNRMISVRFQGRPLNIMVIQVYAPTSNAEEAEVKRFYEDLPTRTFRTNTQKGCPFHYRGLEWKSNKSRKPGVTGKYGLGVQKEAGQRLIEFCQENTLVITNTLFQQDKRRLYTWASPDGQHWNQIDYTLCSQRWRSSTLSAKQDQELTVAQITASLSSNSYLSWRK